MRLCAWGQKATLALPTVPCMAKQALPKECLSQKSQWLPVCCEWGSDRVLDRPAGIGTGSETGRGPSWPYGKRWAAQVMQPWALHCGPHSPRVSPAAQVARLSEGLPAQVPPG